ncbi:MAG: hypothetical protein K2H61_04320 [Muribaculaceae bacterium]|nr:hypothetical protein [Muribaculaceae bacterium]
MAKRLDQKFVHYGIRRDDLSMFEAFLPKTVQNYYKCQKWYRKELYMWRECCNFAVAFWHPV